MHSSLRKLPQKPAENFSASVTRIRSSQLPGRRVKSIRGSSSVRIWKNDCLTRDFFPEGSAYYPVTEDDTHTEQIIVPVISSGDSIGAVCFLSMKRTSSLGEAEQKVADMVARYLALTMEP